MNRPARLVLWLMAFAVPLAIFQESHNSVLVKFFIFTVLSGFLLLLAGLKLLKEPLLPRIPLILWVPVAILTIVHLYQPSNPGISRILLVASGSAVYVSAKILRLNTRQIILPLLWGGMLALIISLFLPNATNRLYGTFGNANLIGSFAAGLFPVGIAVLWGRGWKRILLQVFISFVCLAVIYKSGTRASMVALPAGIIAALLFRWNRKLLLPLAAFYFLAVFISLFQNVLHVPDQEGSLGVRQVVWQGSREMFLQKPLAGWGTGSFQIVFPVFRPGDFSRRGMPPNIVHAHSEPIELLTENGLAGLILWSVIFLVLLKRGTGSRSVSAVEWGAVTGIAVLLIEGLVSVALRWTSSFYLLTLLFSALPCSSDKALKIPKWGVFVPLAAALFLIGPGTLRVYRMAMGMHLYDSAVTAQNDGLPASVSRDKCLRSLEYNSWELASWSFLGNLYGIEAGQTEETGRRIELLEMQLAAYDSLGKRAPDYGYLVLNRAHVYLQLGRWDQGMDDLMHMYRTQFHFKRLVVDTGTEIAPLADAEKSLQFINLIYSSILASTGGSDSLQNADRMVDALGITYAIAANHAPGAVEAMRITTDSVLARTGGSLRAEVNRMIDTELLLAPDGLQLLQEYYAGRRDGLEEQCTEAMNDPGVYAVYYRMVLCLLSAEEGDGCHLDVAMEQAFILHDTCYPLVNLFPGGTEIFAVLPEISAVSDNSHHQEVLRNCFHYSLEMDAYADRVCCYLGNCLNCQDAETALQFRFDNLIQMERILHVPGAESPEFRIAAEFTLFSLGIVFPGSDIERTEGYTLGRIRELKHELVQSFGIEEASRIFTVIINEELNYIENGPYNSRAKACATGLKAMFPSLI